MALAWLQDGPKRGEQEECRTPPGANYKTRPRPIERQGTPDQPHNDTLAAKDDPNMAKTSPAAPKTPHIASTQPGYSHMILYVITSLPIRIGAPSCDNMTAKPDWASMRPVFMASNTCGYALPEQ